MTTELTAAEENAANRLNDTVTMAINKVIGQDSQSYEDFIGGFQHITKETVAHQKKSASKHVCQKSRHDVGSSQTNSKKENRHDVGSSQTNSKSEPTQNVAQSYPISDEELDEEILDCGTRTTAVTSQAPAPRVQFDNFVEEEISDDDTPGYIASFGEESKQDKRLVEVDGITEDSEKCETSSKDKNNMSTELCQNSESINSSNELDNPKHMEDPLCHKDLSKELEGPDNTSEVMEDHTDHNNVINGDIDQSSDESYSIVTLGKGITSQEVTLYPGEAEPEQEVQKGEITNHTHLQFSATNCTESSDDVSQMNVKSTDETLTTETPTDEVQPFSLDDDFDYDNVILTPKFTIQEVQHLKSFLPTTNIQT